MESDEQWPAQADVLKLKTEISKTHEAVTTMAAKRFRFFLCRLATEQGVPLDCDTVNDLCGGFKQEAAEAGKSVIVKKKLCVCQNIFKENLSIAQIVRRASSVMEAAPHCFGCELEKAFIRHSGPFFTSHSKDAAKVKLIKRAGAVFSKDIAQRAADHFHQLNSTLLNFYGKHQKNLGKIPLPSDLFAPRPPSQAAHTPAAPVCTPRCFRIVDPFGRGLLHPMDILSCIADPGDEMPADSVRFPREYCRPILEVLKALIFGEEKYMRINAKFLKSMTDFCGTDHPERDLLEKFYGDEQVVQFLARFVLYILMSLESETRRMFFIRKVNKILDTTENDTVEPFTTAHLWVLLEAWITYADQNRQYLPEKTVNKVTASIHAHAMEM